MSNAETNETKTPAEQKSPQRSMHTRSFLILIFGAVVVFTFVRVVYAVYNFDRLLNDYNARVTYNDRVNDTIVRVATNVIDSETGLRGWLVTHDRRFLQPYDSASVVREDELRDLVDIESDEPRVKATAQRMTSRIHEWMHSYAEPMIASDGKSGDAATFLSLQLFGKARMDLIRADVDELRGDLGERRKAEGEALKAYRDELSRSAYLGSAFIALLFIGLGIITVRRIDGPISNIVEYLNRSWDKRVGGIDAHGLYEIEELAHAVETSSNLAFRDRVRAQAFTELATKLSGGGDFDDLATDALRWLITQFEGNGGALWMVEGGELRLSACIGVHRESLEKKDPERVKRILTTGKSERFDNLAGESRIIRSALIDIAPKSLLILPIRAGARTVAIVEIVGDTLEESPDLLAAVDRVGLALENASSTDRVKGLGAALASANDELRAQMEELRAQGQELQSQAEELVEKQKELSFSNAELEKGSRLKSEFLSDMSHELRTPLNAVLGFSELLISDTYGKLNDAQRERIGDIAAAGRQLLTLVNDILDLSRIEAGRVELKLAPIDLRGPIEDALSLMAPIADVKKVRISADISESLRAVADPDRLRQIVVNFLSNAIKFSPADGVVSLTARARDEKVRIEVKDRGVGISREDAKKLFAPFSQLKAGKVAGGAGLGLSISRRLVELMSGEIGVESEVGKGATFYFTLPISTATADGRPKTAAPRTTGSHLQAVAAARGPKRRVLIVEDDVKHARATQEILGRAGHDVQVVGNAEDALAVLLSKKIDLLVVDLELPTMSGFSLIERVRADEVAANGPQAKPIAIVVLTGRDLDPTERAKLEKRVDLLAEKGVMTGAGFLDAISGVCEKTPMVDKPRVLVVDDSAINRSVLRAMLESAGFEVQEAERAREGIRMAQEGRPMVILMDIRMPDMNGLDATRALREDPRTGTTPVIAVSAQAMTGDRELAFEAGCVAYVTKPVARQELLSAISGVLQSSVAE
jgi:signal transduction histidine kinase/DNA-binding response OmpR family regulator/CHASE3 domain sensor protein